MQLSELHSFIDYVKENKPLIAKAPISFLLGFRTTKWLREHLEHDPSRIATLVKCPVVIFSGDKDFQLDAINDGQRLARLITNAGNCNVKANVAIFATSNSTERLSKPLLSRFIVFEIPEYTYEEFEAISVRIIKRLPQNAVIQIASSVWKTGSKDIRDVLKIAKLCNPADTEEDIHRLITISQKYRKTGKEFN
jgi:hypothetical protein